MPLTEINARWDEVNRVLCPMAFIDPERLDFYPDFGLTMLRLGGANFTNIFFPWVPVQFIMKASDELVTVTCTVDLGRDYCVTFDLDMTLYTCLLDMLPEAAREKTKRALSHQPYQLAFDDDPPSLTLNTVLGKMIISTDREDYVPFNVTEVRECKLTAEQILKAFPYETPSGQE